MAQKFTIYPLGNAETCLLELNNGGKILFDYAAMNDGSETDDRFDIERELSSSKETIFYKGIMPSETGFRFSSGL